DLPGLVMNSAGAPPNRGAHPHVPWWFYPAHSLLALTLTAYLCLLVPRLRLSVAMLATLLLFMFLIVTQLGAAIARHYWLPLGLSAQNSSLGLRLIGAWYGQGVWQRRHQVVSRELGALKMQQGDWEGASAALLQCATAPEVLADLYDQAREHEEQGRAVQARRVYTLIQQRRSRYRDVPQRLTKIPPAAAAATVGAEGLAKTMVQEIGQPHRRLVWSASDREVGRRAKGTV